MYRLLSKLLSALFLTYLLSANSAYAQAARTWVSGVGDDVNPCSRTAPCKTFAGAISKTAAAGEINTLDPGGFGSVTITKSITIRSEGSIGGITASLVNGVIINAAATDRVVLYGLDINGISNGINGVNVINAGTVLISNCTIHGFRGSASSSGVLINSTSFSRVTIDHCTINNNSIGVSVIAPNANGHAKVLDSLILDNTSAGIRVSGSGNDAFILNNRILGSLKALEMILGGTTKSFGGNLAPAGDLPTTTDVLR